MVDLKFLIDIYRTAFLCILMKVCKRLFSIPSEFFFKNLITSFFDRNYTITMLMCTVKDEVIKT